MMKHNHNSQEQKGAKLNSYSSVSY